ncbi:CoA-binding protein [Sulfurimonas sp.]|uniref:CoA-binding protein n=1 Tax=Sulfurimonas sp. TaxID=2022749 RepID=UPI0019ED0E47|nr:CoA-binding protein [Sulfurimonas sp.]MBE0514161.1 CoA-binding protein [Sulfurimonas sp.]
MECEIPTVNSNKQEIREIFDITRTIAIIGLSPDESKASHRVAKYLKEQGYKIVPIYPKEETILGEKVYRSLSEVPFAVDMVDIFRKPKELDNVADACIQRGDVKVFWAQKDIVNNEAAARAKAAGMRVVQNMCTMVEHRVLREEA